jgi:hypothetical protein
VRRFRVDAFSMSDTASGVLQLVSPWSTSTVPMRLAALGDVDNGLRLVLGL